MSTPCTAIHLCGLPGSVYGRDVLSLHGLAPGGVYQAAPVARDAGALLPHLFTLTRPVPEETGQAVCFLWHFPSSRLDWRKPAPFPTESRPSSTQRTAPRPFNQLPVTSKACVAAQPSGTPRSSVVVWDRPNKLAVVRRAHAASCCGAYKPSGGDGRGRTDDLLFAKQVLYQLSYTPLENISTPREIRTLNHRLKRPRLCQIEL